jgi:hypothetical protein
LDLTIIAMQICFPGVKPAIAQLAELVPLCRDPSSPPHG